MNRVLARAGRAVAVAACTGGLLALGPSGTSTVPAPARTDSGQRVADPAAQAVRAARASTRRQPEDPAAWSGLAAAVMEQARTTMDAGQLAAAEDALRRSMKLKPHQNYAALSGLGQLANARHDFSRGREHGRRAVRMAPDRPDAYAVLADAEIQLGHYGAARAAVQRLLDLAPGSAAYSRAAYDLQTHGRDDDALIALRRAEEAAVSPGEAAHAASGAGDLAWSEGKIREAGRHYARALRADPHHPHALAGVARVHAARGRVVTALRRYEKLTDRVPAPQFLLEHYEASLAAGRAGRPATRRLQDALDAQLRLARAQKSGADPYLARYAADHGKPEAAVALLRREAEESHSVIVADAYGWALHRAGREREALPWVRRATRTGWHNPLFHCHRGHVEKALGISAGARRLETGRRLNSLVWPCRSPRVPSTAASGATPREALARRSATTPRHALPVVARPATVRTAGPRPSGAGAPAVPQTFSTGSSPGTAGPVPKEDPRR